MNVSHRPDEIQSEAETEAVERVGGVSYRFVDLSRMVEIVGGPSHEWETQVDLDVLISPSKQPDKADG